VPEAVAAATENAAENAAAGTAETATCPPLEEASRDTGARDTLYYDGQCPLCAAEIEALARARGDALRLLDIHDRAALAVATGDSREEGGSPDAARAAAKGTGADAGVATATRPAPGVDELLRTLHLQRADGTWLTGADANVAAWEDTRRGRLLRVLRWPLLRPFVDLGYRVWAFWRYRRLYGRQFNAERHAPRSKGD
jgi:predicted DCC family thiol-disulfide oxidoreductase YuxK